ncbi:collagen binding domain-containing protein [Paenibacillus sp. PsM32]|uniref:collagen binding domain-containing protein n=1 Tax=unclassified Paenibacillus TaxID=185978 RepID=UPI0023663C03|nr:MULTISPECIES: collagen binding domain-containing protein [unclassified Paenibacillus]MDN4619370.1 collagen binding domain-containing protein [Paenibacillus sp. PsM32]WDF50431.1 collagen binding domain-containing protein [Paenibacillus sp. KACC 21273]
MKKAKQISAFVLSLILMVHLLVGATSTIYAADTSSSSSTESTDSSQVANSGSTDTTSTNDQSTVQSDTYAPTDGSGSGNSGSTGDPSTTPPTDPTTPTTPEPAPVANSQSILTNVTIVDANNNVIDMVKNPDYQIEAGAPVSLIYQWALPDDGSYKAGSTYEFDIPAAFKLYNDINNVPLSFDGDSVGSFNVTSKGHVTMTFNKFVEEHSQIGGMLQINTEFSKEILKGSTEIEIPFPINGSDKVIVIVIKPEKGAAISKKGDVQKNQQVNWTVDVNTNLKHIQNGVLTDPIPTGLTLDPNSIHVYNLDVNVDGSTKVGQEITSGYQLTTNPADFKITFAQDIRSAYRVTYSTAVDKGTQTSYTNTATLTSSVESVKASATVSVKRGEFLSKNVVGYDDKTRTISWSINYNMNEQPITKAKALLKDRFNGTQQFLQNTFKVVNVTTGTTMVEGTDYTLTPVTNDKGTNGFDLQFNSDITSGYTITYQTQATGRVYTDEKVINKVTSDGTGVQAGQNLQSTIFVKTLSDANYISKIATWKLVVNRDGYTMSDVAINDYFTNGGLEFLPSTLVVRTADGAKLPKSAYTVTTSNAKSGFDIKFAQDVKEQLTIQYGTTFNNDWKIDKTKPEFYNGAKLTWTENGTPRSQTTEARFWPDNMTVNNGSKEGVYNATTKEITWTIKANYNKKELPNAVITDTLESGQTYVPGSLEVNNLNLLGWWNGTSKGSTVDSSAYTFTAPTAQNTNQLKIAFNDTINTPYWITFKTTLENQVIDSNIHNEAVLRSGNDYYPWAAVVEIPKGGEYVSKTGTQDGDKINWTVYINRGQSYVENAKIVDTPTPNQVLSSSSFHLFAANVASNGGLSKGTEMVKGTDYKLAFFAGEAPRFELTFIKPIRSAFILEYSSMITAADREAVSNSVAFSGNGITKGTVATEQEIEVRTSSGSGTGSGVVGKLAVQKVDKDDKSLPLEDATFKLQDVAQSKPAIELTTDAQGQVMYTNLLYGKYTLQEIKAPAGYVLDPTVHDVTIDSSTLKKGNMLSLTITNEKQPVVIPPVTQPPVVTPPGGGGGGTPETPPTTPTTPTTPDGTTPTNPGQPSNNDDDDVPGGRVEPTPDDPFANVPVNDDPIPQGSGEPTPDTPTQPSQPGNEPSTPVSNNPTPDSPSDPEVPINDDPIPQGNVPVTPDKDIPVNDDPIPKGTVPSNPSTPTNTPDVDRLPQTGESSNMPFWLAGSALLLFGLIMRRVHHNKQARSK